MQNCYVLVRLSSLLDVIGVPDDRVQKTLLKRFEFLVFLHCEVLPEKLQFFLEFSEVDIAEPQHYD